MKTRETTPGRTYSVHTTSGCTIIEPDGWHKTIEAPDGYFDAHFGNVVIEGDDEASIKELFKLAPYQKLRLLGVVGGGVPAWLAPLKAELTALLDGSQFELAWLAGENTLVVHTDRVSDELLAAVKATAEAAMPATATLVQYNHHIDISWRDINKYAECVTVRDMLAVNPDYQNDLTSDGQWLYPLPEMTTAPSMNQSTARVFVCNLPKVRGLYGNYKGCGFEIVEYNVPNNDGLDSVFRTMPNLHTVNGDFTKIRNGMNAMAGNRKLTSFNSSLPSLTIGWCMLSDAKLDKESALRVLLSIPNSPADADIYTGSLLIGIHVDHKTDDEVLAAIANAEAKGWTLTVQWNGTPTSTASTMAMGQLIYAKVGERELSDGTVERVLDWGHYVTNPEGYETFRSLASAYRYFGIPIPAESQPTE